MYGAIKTSTGEEIGSNSESKTPLIGTAEQPFVDNNKLSAITLSADEKSLSFEFKQSNGVTIRHNEREGTEAFHSDNTNRRVKHICTKIVSEDEYNNYDKGNGSFASFAKAIIRMLEGRYSELSFRMLFIYNKKAYVSLPTFPNFIERMETNPTSLVLSDYNKKRLIKPIIDEVTPDVESADSQISFN